LAAWYLRIALTDGDVLDLPAGNSESSAQAWLREINDELARAKPSDRVVIYNAVFDRSDIAFVSIVPFSEASEAAGA
jgi:hypothetical protein